MINGWQVYAHPLFLDQLQRLTAAVEVDRAKNPDNFRYTPNAKLLAALNRLVFETIPQDPARPDYRQGGTLGERRKHWFRAKFGANRFRLFFRYRTTARIIIFVWVNDETTLRTHGAKTDAYAVFRKMLDADNQPDDWSALPDQSSAEPAKGRFDDAQGGG